MAVAVTPAVTRHEARHHHSALSTDPQTSGHHLTKAIKSIKSVDFTNGTSAEIMRTILKQEPV
jgi:hypothetical protein